MITITYFFSMAFLAYIGILFRTDNAVNLFCKVTSLLMSIVGFYSGLSLLNGEEIHYVSYVAMGWSALMGAFFLFAKGDNMFAIFTKALCFSAVLSSVLFFSV